MLCKGTVNFKDTDDILQLKWSVGLPNIFA